MGLSWVNQLIRSYNETMELADPRALKYPLMNSVVPNMVSTIIYLWVVLYAGPKYMKKRQPLQLRPVIALYNLCMVIFALFLFYEFLMSGWATGYSFTCQECDYSNSPQALRMVRVCYLFWLSKHIEFLDTVFFIARKKFQHVSFLHVFHHSIMAFTWWFGVKFSPGGLGTFHGMINSFVHLVMYTYYGIAALGPAYQKYLWWKKYLTVFQMTQFVVVFSHIGYVIAFTNCKYPEVFKYIIGAYGTIFFILFADFWTKAYSRRPSQKVKDEPKTELTSEPAKEIGNGESVIQRRKPISVK
ncbi:very long chain fatty acid elongase 7-like [Styela clava]